MPFKKSRKTNSIGVFIKKLKKKPVALIILIILLLTLPFGLYQVIRGVLHFPSATTEAQFSFDKNQYVLTSGSDVKLLINSGIYRVGFVRASLNYDPSQVVLSKEIVVNPVFGTVISSTPMTEANTTGKIVVVAAVSYENPTMPSGVFDFMTLSLSPTNAFTNSTMNVNVGDSQIVNSDARDLTFAASSALFVSPTPVPTATSTSTPVPTATATPVPSPSASPTPTPPSQTHTLIYEAEDGALQSPMDLYPDVTASGGYFVMTQTKNKGVDAFKFQVPANGNYVVWARVMSPNNRSDSFSVAMDGSSVVFDTAQSGYSNNWQWSIISQSSLVGKGKKVITGVSEPYVYSLNTGLHTLEFIGRETGTKLDKIIITNDLNFKPSN